MFPIDAAVTGLWFQLFQVASENARRLHVSSVPKAIREGLSFEPLETAAVERTRKSGVNEVLAGAHVAVIDDEADVRETIAEYLEARGLRVSRADGAMAARALFAEDPPDIVVLDLCMPGEDGLSLARWLRAETAVGIVMLTALSDPVDRVVGLELGADDYLAKPVDLRELAARVKAVLRRTRRPGTTPGPTSAAPATRRVPFGHLTLDLDAHKLFDPHGQEVALTAMEFDLLKAFAENPNRVLTRDRLLDLAHNRNWEPFDRSIDIRIARIRRKVEADPAKPQIIKTIRGSGYLYSPTPRT